jgi:hypothetical protein
MNHELRDIYICNKVLNNTNNYNIDFKIFEKDEENNKNDGDNKNKK